MRHRLHKPLLRAARALLGLSQQEVAHLTQVSTGSVAHMESDVRTVKLETELAVRDLYESRGIEFVVEEGGRIGVFLNPGADWRDSWNASNDKRKA